MVYSPVYFSEEQIYRFKKNGFLVVENFIDSELAAVLRDRVEPLFHGNFETGIIPDEWQWRPGLSRSNASRIIVNAWKSDLTIASVALSAEIGRLCATLAGWQGARIGHDSVWMKVPGSGKIALHQDARYLDYINPRQMITCWIALDDTRVENGTIEYVLGSHRWPLAKLEPTEDYHWSSRWSDNADAPVIQDYHYEMKRVATVIGVAQPEIVKIEIPAGSCIFHHGDIWHGSGENITPNEIRRALTIFTLSSDACFHEKGGRQLMGRYKRFGDKSMDESFFPILWTENNYRSSFLVDYCQDALGYKLEKI
ncbi:MAG: phytanoyl-CoA dioxygenase family protein [Xenococcaceae cyanobacterium MO_188.B32]|nr:phytanoyl-CoA dioxygenase family protein [Xenococcaceae cyanobacterium MO_188.B32]